MGRPLARSRCANRSHVGCCAVSNAARDSKEHGEQRYLRQRFHLEPSFARLTCAIVCTSMPTMLKMGNGSDLRPSGAGPSMHIWQRPWGPKGRNHADPLPTADRISGVRVPVTAWLRLLAATVLLLAAGVQDARAHPAPFSYLDVHVGSTGLSGRLSPPPNLDVAHDLEPAGRGSGCRATRRVQPHADAIVALMRGGLALFADGRRGAMTASRACARCPTGAGSSAGLDGAGHRRRQSDDRR